MTADRALKAVGWALVLGWALFLGWTVLNEIAKDTIAIIDKTPDDR